MMLPVRRLFVGLYSNLETEKRAWTVGNGIQDEDRSQRQVSRPLALQCLGCEGNELSKTVGKYNDSRCAFKVRDEAPKLNRNGQGLESARI